MEITEYAIIISDEELDTLIKLSISLENKTKQEADVLLWLIDFKQSKLEL